ncbi:MAG: hypothetical protein SCALA702_05920 [Melioribacteraceae bacterium]|nr:MAG: hypothetical protein SCALA702_05920 [Melioribacteraceae bacterium]
MSAIKEKVDTFILEVENIAFGELIHKDDVKRLLEIIFETKKEKILFELSFAAKYNTGILRIIRNGAKEAEDEYFSRIKKEYSENLTKLKVYLEDILSGTTDYYKNLFEKKYFGSTQKALDNLNDLCEDFAKVKLLLDDRKYA